MREFTLIIQVKDEGEGAQQITILEVVIIIERVAVVVKGIISCHVVAILTVVESEPKNYGL